MSEADWAWSGPQSAVSLGLSESGIEVLTMHAHKKAGMRACHGRILSGISS